MYQCRRSTSPTRAEKSLQLQGSCHPPKFWGGLRLMLCRWSTSTVHLPSLIFDVASPKFDRGQGSQDSFQAGFTATGKWFHGRGAGLRSLTKEAASVGSLVGLRLGRPQITLSWQALFFYF